jgi:hypothetical protein
MRLEPIACAFPLLGKKRLRFRAHGLGHGIDKALVKGKTVAGVVIFALTMTCTQTPPEPSILNLELSRGL